MIKEISISNFASYKDVQKLEDLDRVNFVYGANGCGKTTISRLLSGYPELPEGCDVVWEKGLVLKAMVFNRDFVEENFRAEKIKGVFTLGNDTIELKRKIEQTKGVLDDLKGKHTNLKTQLDGFETQFQEAKNEFQAKCWVEIKKCYEGVFKFAFAGGLTGQRQFAELVQKRYVDNAERGNASDVNDLKDRAGLLFGTDLASRDLPVFVDLTRIRELEMSDLPAKPIIGRSDVDVAQLIKSLGNGDWVRQGLSYVPKSFGKCPFCQGEISDDLVGRLESYFDKSFELGVAGIRSFYEEYSKSLMSVLNVLEINASKHKEFGGSADYGRAVNILRQRFESNKEKLEKKISSPSQSVELLPVSDVVEILNNIIAEVAKKVDAHNKVVQNVASERLRLIGDIWYYISAEGSSWISVFLSQRSKLAVTMKKLTDVIESTERSIKEQQNELSKLESSQTSVKGTIIKINNLIRAAGFRGFTLEEAPENSYVLKRDDGSLVETSLSEGEHSLVSFLYFYSLLEGSQSTSGISEDRVVVIDDPISSLDADVMFMVSSLIRGLINPLRKSAEKDLGPIKQLVLLTHNVFFFKEITFVRDKEGGNGHTKYYVVRKSGGASRIEPRTSNPIKTSYELLWREVMRKTDVDLLVIQNAMRRILEYYFRILGGLDFDKLIEKFQGDEARLPIVRSLFSWVNEGSHFASDDLYYEVSGASAENYQDVFKMIFDYSGHSAHYKMMTRVDGSENQTPVS